MVTPLSRLGVSVLATRSMATLACFVPPPKRRRAFVRPFALRKTIAPKESAAAASVNAFETECVPLLVSSRKKLAVASLRGLGLVVLGTVEPSFDHVALDKSSG